mmetsp:Transcript_12710/g.21411  ORF Transcript_12710/g.21411 Transcript_12710/m.21411 type:complete len:96 (+) Transcript_12710:241-528(+)
MRENGETEYKIAEIKPLTLKKVNNYRRLLFFVNIPMIVGIPFCLETGTIIDKAHAESADSLYLMMQMVDFMLFFNSVIIYSTLKRIVSSVVYVPG